jgi:hypothetical protein
VKRFPQYPVLKTPIRKCTNSRYLLWNTQARLRGGQFRVRFLGRVRNFSLLKNVQIVSGAHPVSQSMGAVVLSRKQSGRGVELTTQLNLVPRLRMGGTTPPLPLYAFTAQTGTTLLLYTQRSSGVLRTLQRTEALAKVDPQVSFKQYDLSTTSVVETLRPGRAGNSVRLSSIQQ